MPTDPTYFLAMLVETKNIFYALAKTVTPTEFRMLLRFNGLTLSKVVKPYIKFTTNCLSGLI